MIEIMLYIVLTASSSCYTDELGITYCSDNPEPLKTPGDYAPFQYVTPVIPRGCFLDYWGDTYCE